MHRRQQVRWADIDRDGVSAIGGFELSSYLRAFNLQGPRFGGSGSWVPGESTGGCGLGIMRGWWIALQRAGSNQHISSVFPLD